MFLKSTTINGTEYCFGVDHLNVPAKAFALALLMDGYEEATTGGDRDRHETRYVKIDYQAPDNTPVATTFVFSSKPNGKIGQLKIEAWGPGEELVRIVEAFKERA